MKILGFEFKRAEKSVSQEPQSTVYQGDYTYGHSYPIVNKNWDGEKTLGELGVVVRNIPDYQKLRLRSYHAYATIDTVKIIASKFFYWTIGVGLKLQAEPNRTVLESEGINNGADVYAKFQKMVEARFMVYANSKECDYLKEKTLHELALDTYQGEFLGGDMLVIIRFDDNGPNIQLLSGDHVCNPGLDEISKVEERKNYVEHGIEIDEKGAHVAYFVKTKQHNDIDKYERIPAKGAKTGKRLAWLISGKKISPDHLRGVPAMAQSLEKINKLDRYVEAAVTNAEQGAKIVYSIEHQEFSSGESPLDQVVARKRNPGILSNANGDESNPTVLADGLANRITETTSGQTFNLPNGASLKAFDSKIETNFGEFHSTVFKSISAGVDVPPEVAMQEYNSNYSASRAAINSFGYIIVINRQKFANDFYIPFYKLWLEWQVLNKKITAPGYIENITNFMVTESYTQCRFTGKNMPHIDPLKEIKAVREMLGIDGATPLISREQAVEMLNAGQWDENFMKYMEEEGIIPEEEVEEETDSSKTEKNGTE